LIAVLVRLQWMSLKGRVVRSIRLLRQPKYLVGSVIGFGWMAFWVVRPMLASRLTVGARPWNSSGGEWTTLIPSIAALAVTVLMPLPWLFPWGRLGLPFREAELTMLLQAPLTRRQVVQYGLLKSELGVVISSAVMSMFLARGRPLGWPLTFLGTWLLFELWHLNGRWRALFNLRQTELPAARARGRRLILTIALLGFYAVLLLALFPMQSQVAAAFRGGDRAQIAAALVDWPPLLVALLTPGRWLIAPMFAGGALAFLAAALPVLLAVLAQRELVLRSKARFEESSLEAAKTEETKKSPTRRFARVSSRGRSNRPFELDSAGAPMTAVVWKNAMRVSRAPWVRLAIGGSVLLVAVAVIPLALPAREVIYSVLAATGAGVMFFFPLVGGMAWNNDFRTELAHLELVRTWPLSSRRFALAQLASPALFSFATSTFGAGLLLAGLFGSRQSQASGGEPAHFKLLPSGNAVLGVPTGLAAVIFVASCLPITAAASFLSSALQNLATLFVPAWMAHGEDRPHGVEAFGRRLLFSSAFGLAYFLSLIPSALLVGSAVLVQRLLGIGWTAWEFPFWGALAAAPLLVEGWWIAEAATGLWTRLDPSQELLEIGR